MTPRVAYAGEPGAFAEDATIAYFGDAPGVPVPGFRDVFEAVSGGCLPGDPAGGDPIVAGVVPIENLVNGTVRENYDLLLEHDLVIVGEVVVPVRLCVAALPGETLDSVERVYSHIQALGQAERFLRRRPWSLLTTYNTAGAAKLIADRGERRAAALLSPRAASLFGLVVLAGDVQDVPDNRTRFLVVAKPDTAVEPGPHTGAATSIPAGRGPDAVPVTAVNGTRTTLVMAVRNEPGALLRCLEVFAAAGINMSKLESRPSRDRAWEYVFWVDLDTDATSATAGDAIDRLAAVAASVRVLGSYPKAAQG